MCSKRSFHSFTDCLLFLISFGIMLLALLSYNAIENNYIIRNLINSWSKSPITIIQSNNNDLCSETDTNLFSVSNYIWPGSLRGCDCSFISHLAFQAELFKGYYFKGSCIYNQTLAGCSEIKETPKSHLYMWRGSNLCHREFGKEYFQLKTVRSGDKCPISYKTCGKIDTLENKLCVKEFEDCPINHFARMETGLVKFDVSNKNTDGFILTEFHVTDGQNVCINNEENLFSEHDHILFSEDGKKGRTGCKSYVVNPANKVQVHYDPRFKLVDSIAKKLYYKQNGIIIENVLPNFLEYTKDHSIQLFTAPYIGWDKNCVYIGETSITEEIINLSGHLNDIEKNHKIILLLSFLILSYIFAMIFYWKYEQSGNVQNWFVQEYKFIFTLFLVLNIYNLYLIRTNINSIYLNKSNTSFFDSLFNKNCSDYLTNISLKHFGQQFFLCIEIYNFMSIVLVINMISVFIIVLFTIYTHEWSDNFKKKKEDDYSSFALGFWILLLGFLFLKIYKFY